MTTYTLDLDRMTVGAIEDGETSDLNATGEPIATQEELAAFVRTLHQQGAYNWKTETALLGELPTVKASDLWKLTEEARVTVEDVVYVVANDGNFTCAVEASAFDAVSGAYQGLGGEGYSLWCAGEGCGIGASNLCRTIASAAGLEGLHVAGSCGWVDAWPTEAEPLRTTLQVLEDTLREGTEGVGVDVLVWRDAGAAWHVALTDEERAAGVDVDVALWAPADDDEGAKVLDAAHAE